MRVLVNIAGDAFDRNTSTSSGQPSGSVLRSNVLRSKAAASASERCAATARRGRGGGAPPQSGPRSGFHLRSSVPQRCCQLDLGPENYKKISTGELTTGGG